VIVVVALVVLGGAGWAWLDSTAAHKAAPAAADCPDGHETVQVAAAPVIAAAVERAAIAYGRTSPVVADHCVDIAVSAVDPQTVVTALHEGWDAGKLGPKPQAWIADSTLWTNQLAATDGAAVGDAPQSVAASPVVLAMPPDAAKAVNSTGAPTFAALPTVVTKGNGWADYGEPSWGQITVALPNPGTNATSTLAAEAMLDPATPQGQPPITSALLASPTVRQNLDNLAVGQPTPTPVTTHEALVALGRANGIQNAPFSAVMTTEVALYERNLGVDGDAKPVNVLDEVRLGGATPFADFPFTPLAGNWVTSDQVDAAQHFRDFLLTPAQQTQLAKSGFRVTGTFVHPDASPGMDWGSASHAPTPTDTAGFQALAAAWNHAGQPGR
jgi:hypothetical protein